MNPGHGTGAGPGTGIHIAWPMMRFKGLIPGFAAISAFTVVPKRCAIANSVSPCLIM